MTAAKGKPKPRPATKTAREWNGSHPWALKGKDRRGRQVEAGPLTDEERRELAELLGLDPEEVDRG